MGTYDLEFIQAILMSVLQHKKLILGLNFETQSSGHKMFVETIKSLPPLFPYLLNKVNDPLLPPFSLFVPYISLLVLLIIGSSVPEKSACLSFGCHPKGWLLPLYGRSLPFK